MAKGKKGRVLNRNPVRRAAGTAHAILTQPTRTISKYPLPGTFMVSGLVGFVISVIYTASGRFELWFGDLGLSLGVAFMIVFMVMFIAALFSITPGSEDLQ